MVGGYSTNNTANTTALWKLLGYKSQQDYINATSGANGNKAVSPLVGIGGTQGLTGVPTKIPTSPTTVQMPTLQTAYGSLLNGGASGGVTSEGAIIGNPSVNNDTFKSPTATPTVPTTIGGQTITLPTSGSSVAVKAPTNTAATTPTQTEPTARTDEGSYNGTNSFLEWYKENYGTDYDPSVGFSRREGMNDGVWNVGANLYNYYLQGLDDDANRASEEENRNKYYDEQLETLLGEYSTSREALDKSKRQQQQNASITLDKLKKYLPTQIKAQGLGGLGVSESTMLQAYNNYNNDMGAIESDYQANKTSLDVGETSAKNTLENYRQDALQKIAEKYTAAADARQAKAGETSSNIFSAYQAQVEEQMRQVFEDAYATISTSTSTSADELMKYIESLRGKVSDTNYSSLLTKAQQVANNNLQAQQEADKQNAYIVAQATIEELIGNGETDKAREYLEANRSILGESVYNSYMTSLESRTEQIAKEKGEAEQAEIDKRVLEGKEFVSYGNSQYKITSQLNQNSNEIKYNNDFTNKLKELGFTNPYDSNIPNGTTLEIKCDNKGKNNFDWWDDVGAFLLSPLGWGAWDSWGNWNTKYVTYYNGEWYLSEKQ